MSPPLSRPHADERAALLAGFGLKGDGLAAEPPVYTGGLVSLTEGAVDMRAVTKEEHTRLRGLVNRQ
jgi:hypothetical protein